MTYSRFMEGLKAAKVALDRKVLADLAATDAAAFTELVKVAQNALKAKAAQGLISLIGSPIVNWCNGRPETARPFFFCVLCHP